MLLCEHSPIRQLFIKCKWYELKSWVSVHFVRHKLGIEHWVRTGVNRDELSQGSFVEHEFIATTQAMINISRKRLCNQESKETQEAWKSVLNSIKYEEPELYKVCVPDCIYRGWCYELKSCGYHKTENFKEKLSAYRSEIEAHYIF